ncbi:MAG TPA: 30S ribosome-binding factor RbfA [Chitinophagales bacterium]|nr:30S ribosome-binding factor RbfA [Chitinophagales bacterium]
MEKVKQKKIASVIQQTLSEIFQKENLSMVKGGMVTISAVEVSPDLSIAKVYLSLFQIKEPQVFLEELKEHAPELRRQLGNKIRNQVRRIPELHFYLDDTLDNVFRLEEIFKQIKKD